ncbi:PQQ-dependent sugar dehydrogenase [Luteococcus peritonei]|uniref:PQQ-dependent sugar dehydrogenase n=1 Tax=Luteococcus peritonei TaxID=88874 RepID=A0ABW4RXI6_9ACTN
MSISRRDLLGLGAGSGAAVLLAGCSTDAGPGAGPATSGPSSAGSPSSTASGAESPTPSPTPSTKPSAAIPRLTVQEAASGLEIPWGLGFSGSTAVLTERAGRIQVLRDGRPSRVTADLDDVAAAGEGGLTGLVVDPKDPRRIVVAFNSREGDVRIVPFTLSADLSRATRGKPLLTGLPANPSGRHSGCRLRFGSDGLLWVGTGDTARGSLPQDRTSLGGKVLRLDGRTGAPAPDNPWPDAQQTTQRYVYSYGHRNVQGLALQPGTGRMFSVEHGSAVDDEVNLLAKGANYGWNPVGSGDYDESVPMTDTTLPGAVRAVWSSGDPTLATSGAAFVTGEAWGGYAGCLAVACLKAQKLLMLRLTPAGALQQVLEVPELDGSHGRLRTVETDPSGALWVTTANGEDDTLLRITPA